MVLSLSARKIYIIISPVISLLFSYTSREVLFRRSFLLALRFSSLRHFVFQLFLTNRRFIFHRANLVGIHLVVSMVDFFTNHAEILEAFDIIGIYLVNIFVDPNRFMEIAHSSVT